MSTSRELGTGFAAPGGEFTRALYEWAMTDRGNFLKDLLGGRRVVELGAGMMPFGYALAATCKAKNFVAVEPFYSDIQKKSVAALIEERGENMPRIPYKVEARDMLEYLKGEADELLCVVACGIEDCIFFGNLKWVDVCSPCNLLESEDPIYQWYKNLHKIINK